MRAIRWKLFKLLSHIGWAICPEPDRSRLLAHMRNDGMRLGWPEDQP